MERFVKATPEDRDVKLDKQSFVEAISTYSVNEIPTEYDESSSQNLLENIAHTNIFILGEMHGVEENTDIIYTLFKKFGFRQLALEWKSELKEVAEFYIKTGELDFNAIQDSPDGRITVGHFALLKILREEGMLDRLICFDGGSTGPDWNNRDSAMARNILAKRLESPVLVVAGNLHAKTEHFTHASENEVLHPMGERIKDEVPAVLSGRIKYGSGQFYNYGTQEFINDEDGELLTSPRFYRAEDGLYLFEIPEAHAAIVPNTHERL